MLDLLYIHSRLMELPQILNLHVFTLVYTGEVISFLAPQITGTAEILRNFAKTLYQIKESWNYKKPHQAIIAIFEIKCTPNVSFRVCFVLCENWRGCCYMLSN